MYCQHCGAESTQGLNYCNRCGGQIGALAQSQPREVGPALPTGTVRAVGFSLIAVVVFGLGILTALMTELARTGMRSDPLIFIMMFGALTVLGSVFMLTRFWMRMLSAGKPEKTEAPRLYAPPIHTNELGPQPQHFAALHDAPIPVPSVTEQTTRTLEHAKKR